MSCPSAWTDFDCGNTDKTRVYLERSRSSPINLQLERVGDLSPHDPFFQVIPHTIPRLRSLAILGTPENIQDFTAHLSRPAPLLQSLAIEVDCGCFLQRGPAITTTLFDGDLSSLRELRLQCITTALPWRNMANLTSFILGYIVAVDFPINHLLDFFESAPRLRKVQLHYATPTSSAQNGRLVSLECLKKMDIIGGGPTSFLLDHLLIPVGAKLTIRVLNALGDSLLDGYLPRSRDNLRNLSDPTELHLHVEEFHPCIRFSGPNGQVTVIPTTSRANTPRQVYESLAWFNTSKIERLTIASGDVSDGDSNCVFYRAMSPMKSLRTFVISRCKNAAASIPYVLDDRTIFPKLEELIIDTRVHGEKFDIQAVIAMAAVRGSGRTKLKSIRIVTHDKIVQTRALKLKEHVSHVECGPGVAAVFDDGNDSDEDDWRGPL